MQTKQVFRAVSATASRSSRFAEQHRLVYYVLVALLFAIAGFIRGWAAPLSAGPDVGQFWAFARTFELHGFDFYRYADGIGPIFPEQAWGYVYPPVWLLILRLALLASPGSLATNSFVDVAWRVAMKTPIIAADLAIGGLLLWAIPGSRLKKLLFAGVWLLHPTAWYNSSVFGQFDAIAAAFLVASVALLVQRRDRVGFIFAGLAILTKQHAALPVLLMAFVLSRQLSMRRILTNCAIVGGMAVLVSLPFVLNGDVSSYARAVLFPAQRPAYQIPLMYAFGGSGALVTHLHQSFGWEIERLLYLNTPLLVVAMLSAAVSCYVKKIKAEQAALVGILLFVALFYRINYQYLVMYLPLALFALSRSKRWIERWLLAALVFLPAAWIWMFDVSFWFWNAAPRNHWVTPLFKRIGLTNYPGEWAYVALAVTLMVICLLYSFTVLARRQPPSTPDSPA